MLAKQLSPNMRLRDVLSRLRCRNCRTKPASVALIERADGNAHGHEPFGWRLELM
jgi:hypothetical protein